MNSDFQHKIKKTGGGPPELDLVENPDILATVAASSKRPDLVVGFAAETEDVETNAAAKRERKGCDWVVANDVSVGSGTFGGHRNTVFLVTADGVEPWPAMAKVEVAERLTALVAEHLSGAATPLERGCHQQNSCRRSTNDVSLWRVLRPSAARKGSNRKHPNDLSRPEGSGWSDPRS